MDLGRKITDLEKMENVPKGTSYLAEAGDGSGTKQIEHEKLVEKIGEDLKLGNLEELDTKSQESVVKAINEVNKKAGTTFEGTDGIKAGTAGVVPQPQPEDAGKVLGANGQWVPPGEGGSLDILDDKEQLEANTDKGKLVDALVVKELNDCFGGVTQLVVDKETGQLTGYKTNIGGADTVFPFSKGGNITLIKSEVSFTIKTNTKATNSSLKIDVKEIISDYESLTVDNFFMIIESYTCATSNSRITLTRSYDASAGEYTITASATASSWDNRNSTLIISLYCVR